MVGGSSRFSGTGIVGGSSSFSDTGMVVVQNGLPKKAYISFRDLKHKLKLKFLDLDSIFANRNMDKAKERKVDTKIIEERDQFINT